MIGGSLDRDVTPSEGRTVPFKTGYSFVCYYVTALVFRRVSTPGSRWCSSTAVVARTATSPRCSDNIVNVGV